MRPPLDLAAFGTMTLVAVAVLCVSTAARPTESQPQASPTAQSPTAPTAPRPDSPKQSKLSALVFLQGTWQGAMGGPFVEEIWSAPHGTSMMGCFRWLGPDGAPAMFELLTITQEQDEVRLRLRHFSPTLAAKEPIDKPQTMRLAESTTNKAVFRAEKDAGALDRITYAVDGDTLRIAVEFVASDPPRDPLKFELKRATSAATAP